MFVPLTTLLVIVVFAFMVGMLTSFILMIQAILRIKK
jgi:hypothetical protein